METLIQIKWCGAEGDTSSKRSSGRDMFPLFDLAPTAFNRVLVKITSQVLSEQSLYGPFLEGTGQKAHDSVRFISKQF
jgi:hypothetical protein